MSTTLDVALALVLVSAAALTVAWAPTGTPAPNDGHDAADRTAETLAASTTIVNYTLAPGARNTSQVTFPVDSGPEFRRSAQGTLARLLARAAVGEFTYHPAGRPPEELVHDTDDFTRGVEESVRETLARPRTEVNVTAVWTPYPGAPVSGRVSLGETPPPRRTHAARMSVPSSVPASRERALRAANRSGYGGVARVLANATVRGLFPPSRARTALLGEYPVSRLVTARYHRAAVLFGADQGAVLNATARRDVRTANRLLARQLAMAFRTDLRRQYDSPRAAARNASTGRVTIVVRTWSP